MLLLCSLLSLGGRPRGRFSRDSPFSVFMCASVITYVWVNSCRIVKFSKPYSFSAYSLEMRGYENSGSDSPLPDSGEPRLEKPNMPPEHTTDFQLKIFKFLRNRQKTYAKYRTKEKHWDEILTVWGTAVLTVRLIIWQVLSVSRRCHGFHCHTGQDIIVAVVKLPLVDSFFSCW